VGTFSVSITVYDCLACGRHVGEEEWCMGGVGWGGGGNNATPTEDIRKSYAMTQIEPDVAAEEKKKASR
jgi:hypothetical protein